MAHQFDPSLPVARSKARRRVSVIIAVVSVVLSLLVTLFWFVPRFISVVAAVVNPTYRHVETSEVSWTDGATFGEVWNDLTKRFNASIVLGSGGASDAQGTYLRIDGHQDMVLSVLVPTNVIDEAPGRRHPLAMQLAITSLVEVPSGAFLPQVYGNPPIICDLDRLQADYVWQHGVPQSLIDEMVETATKAGWKPIPSSGTSTFPGPTIVVLPDSDFPADNGISEDSRE